MACRGYRWPRHRIDGLTAIGTLYVRAAHTRAVCLRVTSSAVSINAHFFFGWTLSVAPSLLYRMQVPPDVGGCSRPYPTQGPKHAVANPDPLQYYAVLGVPSAATNTTLRQAFHRQRAAFHPDRHAASSLEVQSSMSKRFQQVNEAFEVLGDPRRRAAYDAFGRFGVEQFPLVAMSMGERSTSAETKVILGSLHLLQREQQIKRLAMSVSSAGETVFSMAVASGEQRGRVRTMGLAAGSTFLWPLTSSLALRCAMNTVDTTSASQRGGSRPRGAVFAPELIVTFGRGLAAVGAWVELGFGVLPVIGAWFRQELSPLSSFLTSLSLVPCIPKGCSATFAPEAALQYCRWLTPAYLMTNTLRLSWIAPLASIFASRVSSATVTDQGDHIERNLRLRLNPWLRSLRGSSSISTTFSKGSFFGVSRDAAPLITTTLGLSIECCPGQLTSQLSRNADWLASLTSYLSNPLRGSPVTAMTELLLHIDEYQRLGCRFVTDGRAVAVCVIGQRGRHRLSLPVVFQFGASGMAPARAATLLPALVLAVPLLVTVAVRLVGGPITKVVELRRAARTRRSAIDSLVAKYNEAVRETAAITDLVRTRAAAERSVGGLVIQNAKYGIFSPALPSSWYDTTDAPLTVDVTVSMQEATVDSLLDIQEGAASRFNALYDPHPFSGDLERRELRVVYWFNGRRHEATFRDDQPVSLPQISHLSGRLT